jgi:hypothetical protein
VNKCIEVYGSGITFIFFLRTNFYDLRFFRKFRNFQFSSFIFSFCFHYRQIYAGPSIPRNIRGKHYTFKFFYKAFLFLFRWYYRLFHFHFFNFLRFCYLQFLYFVINISPGVCQPNTAGDTPHSIRGKYSDKRSYLFLFFIFVLLVLFLIFAFLC